MQVLLYNEERQFAEGSHLGTNKGDTLLNSKYIDKNVEKSELSKVSP